MLQVMRERMAGIVTATIILILCLAFALWGIQYYLQANRASDIVANVNGVNITQAQFRAAYERARQEQMIKLGKQFSFDQKTQQKLRHDVLQQLIHSEAIYQKTKALGFAVSEQQIDSILEQMPAFQVAGHFSQARFQQILSRMLFSESDFLRNLEQTVIVNQLQSGIARSSFALSHEVNSIVALIKQQRDIGYATVSVSKFAASEQISDNAIANYYSKNRKQFISPEQVSISYIELSQEQLVKKVKATAQALQQYYDNNIDLYSTPKQWYLSRIFVPLAANANRSDKKQVVAKIKSLLKQAKNGVSFAQLDITYGKPTWLGQQQLLGLLKQINHLKVGQISQPIQTEQGYFLVKLLQVKNADTKSFSQVKERVRKAYMQQAALKLFNRGSDNLSDLTYTSSDSLTPAAKKLGLTVQTTKLFTGEGTKDGITAIPNVVKLAFSDNVLAQKYNSNPINVGPGKVIVLRINKHITQAVKPLAEVKLAIRHQLVQQVAKKRAQDLGVKILKAIRQGVSAKAAVQENGLVWHDIAKSERKNSKVDQQIIDAAFDLPLPTKGVPQTRGFSLQDGSFAIIQVTRAYPGSIKQLTAKQLKALHSTLELAAGMRDFEVYAHEVVKAAKIKTYKQD